MSFLPLICLECYGAVEPRPSSGLPYIWRGWVVYGHQERAERLIESATSAEKKATFLASFADLLWRMGQPEQAGARYDVAPTIALRIIDPAQRKPVLATIDQGLQFVSDPPPNLISATPHPRPRPNVQANISATSGRRDLVGMVPG